MLRLLKFIHVNPFYLFMLLGYGLTRIVEWLTNTTEIWSSVWNELSPSLERYKPTSYIIGLPLFIISLHWICYGFVVLYDITIGKLQPHINKKNTKESMNLAKIVLTNQLIILPSAMLVNIYFLKFTNESHLIEFTTVPSFWRMFYKLFMSMIMYEVVYFYFHWMLHHPLIFKQVHKQYYEISTPGVLAHLYQYPIEYILLSILTPSLAMSISHSDTVTATFFMTAIVIGPFFENYGLHLPFLSSYDHQEFNYQYCNDCCGINSTNGMMDILHGTYGSYYGSKNFENHRILLSMKPIEVQCD